MKLSEFELDVMQLFWDSGEQSAPEIHKVVTQSKDVAYTTVKTIIVRLEEKGAIERVRLDGRSIVYRPIVSRKSITSSLLPSFLRRFFGGSSTQLITQLIEDENLNAKDIEYLRRVLDKQTQQDSSLSNDKSLDQSDNKKPASLTEE